MNRVAIIFGLMFFAALAISASRQPVQVVKDQPAPRAEAPRLQETRGACLAAQRGYEAFCSSFPTREVCTAQGGLCRWVNY